MRLCCVVLFLFFIHNNFKGQNLTRDQRLKIEEYYSQNKKTTSIDQSVVLMDKILALDSSEIRPIAYKALNYFKRMDYASALKNFDLFLAKKTNSDFCIYRAELKLKMKDTLGAIKDIEKALLLSGYDSRICSIISGFSVDNKLMEKYFETAVKIHPDNFVAYATLGMIKEKEMNYVAAAQKYKMATFYLDRELFMQKRTENRWIYRRKSYPDFKLKRYKDAIESLTQEILLYPKDPEIYNYRINCYVKLNEDDKVCADLWQLERAGKASISYTSVCDSNKATCRPSKKWLNAIEAEKLYLMGNSNRSANIESYQREVDYYSKALELKPDHIYSLAERSYSYLLLNQMDKQINDLDQVILAMPDCAMAYNFRAGAKRDQGRIKDALEDSDKAIYYDSTNSDFFVQRASIYGRSGDTSKAILDLSKAIQLNPHDNLAYFERSLLELNFKNRPQNALNDILKAIDLIENNPLYSVPPTFYNNCAMVYNKLGQYNKALEYIEKAIAKKPNNGLYYFRAGEIKARMKDLKGACEDWNIAKTLGYKDAEELILYNCK